MQVYPSSPVQCAPFPRVLAAQLLRALYAPVHVELQEYVLPPHAAVVLLFRVLLVLSHPRPARRKWNDKDVNIYPHGVL